MMMECPQATMMGNSSEGDVWMVEIQLMYAQQWPVDSGEMSMSQHEQSVQTQQQLLQQQILMSRGGGGGGGKGGGDEGGGVSSRVEGMGAADNMKTYASPSGGGAGGLSHGGGAVGSECCKRVEKSLRELLEEQDIGKSGFIYLLYSVCSS